MVVLESLPHMSLHGVVAHQLLASHQSQRQANVAHGEEQVVTLAPGCTLMAVYVFTLDLRTLRQIDPISNDSDANADANGRSNKNPRTIQILQITSPYQGYSVSKINNYPYLTPGLPTTYTNVSNSWSWRVTCQPDGAFIRQGLELITDHIGTLSFGAFCCVEKKLANSMGLNRLQIGAFINCDDDSDSSDNEDDCEQVRQVVSDETDATEEEARLASNDSHGEDGQPQNSNANNSADPTSFGLQKLSGWISEFLNPLSGQRGPIVAPIPFPVPAQYRVIHPDRVFIRSGIELSTSQIGFATQGTILSIIGRSFSDHHYGEQCIERLRIAGGGGWISFKLNKPPPPEGPPDEELQLVEMIGVDGSFDPEDPASFHFEAQRRVMQEFEAAAALAANEAAAAATAANEAAALLMNRLGELDGSGRSRRGSVRSDVNDGSASNNTNDEDTTESRTNTGLTAGVTFNRQRSLLGADLSEINEMMQIIDFRLCRNAVMIICLLILIDKRPMHNHMYSHMLLWDTPTPQPCSKMDHQD